ncbi:MAG TPA: UdgX family uracil-DNA binding protein [Candidatus Limnocylindrales bacterium]
MAGLAAAESGAGIEDVAELAAGCRACDLWARATQTVFGEGPVPAPVMLVGEQPGDREDLAGEPFVGPAGQLLDRALGQAGIDRERVFVTNVVKHFKWRPSGKRRLHEKPNKVEVAACHPWLEAELALVRPDAVVCLGATAAAALLGPRVRVSQLALTPVESPLAPLVIATLHPSAILRAADGEAREVSFERLVGDLALVAKRLGAAVAPG